MNKTLDHYECDGQLSMFDKQYWVEATCTVKELQFEEENGFIPMSE